MLAAADSTSR